MFFTMSFKENKVRLAKYSFREAIDAYYFHPERNKNNYPQDPVNPV
jgi:hypothetical protein